MAAVASGSVPDQPQLSTCTWQPCRACAQRAFNNRQTINTWNETFYSFEIHHALLHNVIPEQLLKMIYFKEILKREWCNNKKQTSMHFSFIISVFWYDPVVKCRECWENKIYILCFFLSSKQGRCQWRDVVFIAERKAVLSHTWREISHSQNKVVIFFSGKKSCNFQRPHFF